MKRFEGRDAYGGRQDAGFTLVEILVAVTVGLVLTGIAALNTSGARAGYSISSAERAVAAMAARARSHAVERGTHVLLHVNSSSDSVWVTAGADLVDGVNLAREFGVDLTTESGSFTLCFTPRGFADPNCGTMSGTQKLGFTRGGRSSFVTILPLGQFRFNP